MKLIKREVTRKRPAIQWVFDFEAQEYRSTDDAFIGKQVAQCIDHPMGGWSVTDRKTGISHIAGNLDEALMGVARQGVELMTRAFSCHPINFLLR